ncbi:UNVERIFIED_CONTAM: hypothetical protein ABIC26_004253 [Paenibacillus sp. PvR008]
MGEKSKRSGEYGEKVVSRLLKLIGWHNPVKGIDVKCQNGKEHQIGQNERKTHGLDYLYYYECPLFNSVQENIAISAKYREKYTSNPTSQFKPFLKDIAQTIECLKHDEEYGYHQINSHIKNVNFTGVIFWLAYDKAQRAKGIIEEINDFNNTDSLEYGPVYLVDNKRAKFLLDSIDSAKRIYPNANIEFLYPSTGYNVNLFGKITSGSSLPVQFINTSVLPMKLIDKIHGEILFLTVIDNFDEESLKRLIGLSHNLTEGWGSKIIISFPDYHEMEQSNIVERVKSRFKDHDFIRKVTVRSYHNDLVSLEEDE